MATNVGATYCMYFNYDNDKQVYVLPVLPEKIKVTAKGKTASIDLEKFGEVLAKGKREAMAISFSSYFPAVWGANYCGCLQKDFKEPKAWHKWMLALEDASKPCHFVLNGSPFAVDIYADITSYVAEEAGGDVGTISYTVELKEHRVPSVTKYKVKSSSSGKTTAKKSSTGTRASNKSSSKTYTVKSGDNLWNIAKKYYGNGAKYTKIYSANKTAIEKDAKKHGYSSSNNGNRIWPGLKLKIP